MPTVPEVEALWPGGDGPPPGGYDVALARAIIEYYPQYLSEIPSESRPSTSAGRCWRTCHLWTDSERGQRRAAWIDHQWSVTAATARSGVDDGLRRQDT